MGPFYQQLSNLLTTPPGSLTYYFVIIFSIVWALQAALSRLGTDHKVRASRMVFGFGLLLIARLVLFLVAGIAGQGLASADTLLPPVDRAVAVVSIIMIIWLWAFQQPSRIVDLASILLFGVVVILGIISLVWWSGQSQTNSFNGTLLSSIWEIFAIILTLGGSLILIVRKPDNWGTGLAMLGLNFIGHFISLLFPITTSDFPAAVRLAQMAAYPLLYTLTQDIPALPTPAKKPPEPKESPAVPDQPETTPAISLNYPKSFLKDWLNLENVPAPEKTYQTMAHFLCLGMGADACILVSPADELGEMVILISYNHKQDRLLENIPLSSKQIPLLSNAIQRHRAMRLPADNNSQDLANLKQSLNLEEDAHIATTSVVSSENELLFGAIILRVNPAWSSDEQNQFTVLGQILALMVERSKKYTNLESEFQKQLNAQQQAANNALGMQTDSIPVDPALVEIQEEAQNILRRLKQENTQLKEALAKASPDNNRIAPLEQTEKELRDLLTQAKSREEEKSQEIEQLREKLNVAMSESQTLTKQLTEDEEQTSQSKSQSAQLLTNDQIAEIASNVQELRHPMSTIVDYVDLLLDESVGELGALQRKFLDRIKISIDQLEELINQLVQSTLLDSAKIRVNSKAIDLNAIVDSVLEITKPQIQEKNIYMQKDIQQFFPPIQADGDALQQVLTYLLKNAVIATPTDGMISLQIRMEEKEDRKELLFQVSDSGEGIPSEDLPQVFSRLYRADNASIRGIGPGMGLSIAKTLVEALKGHIWVDSEAGHGSTFSFIIPLLQAEREEGESESTDKKNGGVKEK